MASKITIHNHASDPYWQMLLEGAAMTVQQRYDSFFLMQKRLRAINGTTKSSERKIIIKSTYGFGG